MIGLRGRDRRQHCEAECPADLLRGVDEPAREPLLSLLDSGHRRDRRGDEAKPESDRREQRRPEDVGDEAAADGDLAEPDEAECDERHPRREDRLEAEPGDELPAEAGRDDDRQRQRQVGEPGVDRAVAEHLLHVEGDEEEHREERGAYEESDGVGSGQGSETEDPERDQRCIRAALDRDECSDQRCR